MTEPVELLPTTLIAREIKRRMAPHARIKVSNSQRPDYEVKGWALDKQLKTQVWMRKPKTHDVLFEDRVWAMFARLGFTQLSKDRQLRIQYGKHKNESKQIDVLVADDEVVLVVECKSSAAEQAPTHAFKSEIESIQGYRTGLIAAIRSQFPEHKVKFVFATNNIQISSDTATRIENAGIAYIDEEAISYYHELANHLGSAAKFQLLGNIFHGQQISAMEPKVPAIQGKMGGLTYYSFAIEPERLLKISYVLHRNNANMQWMPTYQRIIKKARLKRVSEFVEKGGFFPNSLLINISNNGKRLRFDKAEKQTGTPALGTLHLPRKYRSAYVIDGQHRLYGFARSDRASTEQIPVVAFVDLDGEKQLELFMQINENQQSVPKNLQNTLNADLLWTSPDLRKRAQALKLKTAQLLGERKSSPLRGRIVIGEEQANERRCISLDAIQRGIGSGRYIGEFTASAPKKFGSFYRTSNDDTCEPLVKFLELCFEYLRDSLPEQWDIGRGDGGFVFTNAGTEACLRLIGDIVDHLKADGRIDPRDSAPYEVFVQVRELLEHLVEYLVSLETGDVAEFRSWLGSGGPTKYLRRFQSAVATAEPVFAPEGLAEWQSDQEKQFNAESYTMIRSIESHLKTDIRARLQDKFGGADWYKSGVPRKVYQEAETLRAAKQYDAEPGEIIDWWDCLHFIQYREILLHGTAKLWNELYDENYTLPSDKKHSSWKDKSSWMVELNDIRNKISHNGTVLEAEFEFLSLIFNHFDLSSTH